MNAASLFESLARSRAGGGPPAVVTNLDSWSYARLGDECERFAEQLRSLRIRVLATLTDNVPAWIAADLAALRAGVVHVPLPAFFTPAQHAHALAAAGADALLVPLTAAAAVTPLGFTPVASEAAARDGLQLLRRDISPAGLPEGTAKVTFTSGTTGAPKGVCLDAGAMLTVAAGVIEATLPLGITRHLCALPFAVLLENVAGVLAPLLRGGTCIVLPMGTVGLTGSSSFDPERLHAAIEQHAAQSVILLPQMLRAWVGWLHANQLRGPGTLRLVAVGGAAVGERLVLQARAVGLPACEGYGLSEGASVQTLNLPSADRPGSAGQALPHARVRIAADGEIEIGGPLHLGYLGERGRRAEWLRTGDLGELDADGFLHVRGRRKNILITAFGRNISPEWVETALRSEAVVGQAAVFGEGQAALSAVLWPGSSAVTDAALQSAVTAANAGLPDYARVHRWIRARAPFDAQHGMATLNGRPRRDAIEALHRNALAGLPDEPSQPDLAGTGTMSFYVELTAATARERDELVNIPIVQACLSGRVSLPSYLAFLREAYHHVRHTTSLLDSCRDRLPPRLAWMRSALDEYIEEEQGHDEWILEDIRACGADPEAVRIGRPGFAAEVMVAFAYDTISRRNPVGFLGMVHVLEGTSVALALMAADRIQAGLHLPDPAFSYLRSHGTLDQSHTQHFARLVDRIEDPADRAAVVHGARMFYRLYGNVFRDLPMPQAAPANVGELAA